ncbi:MAG TPA: hypothetical protein VFF94_00680 [Novosphingobium sp.]|nr:hypothetical protein [Novosphingobium sp.]
MVRTFSQCALAQSTSPWVGASRPSDRLVAELLASDCLVIATPLEHIDTLAI